MDRRTKISTSLFFIRHLSRERNSCPHAHHTSSWRNRGSPSHRPGQPDKPHYTNVETYILRKFKFVVFASLHLSATGVVRRRRRRSAVATIHRVVPDIQETQQSTTTTITNKYYYYYLLSQPGKVRGREEISLFTSG